MIAEIKEAQASSLASPPSTALAYYIMPAAVFKCSLCSTVKMLLIVPIRFIVTVALAAAVALLPMGPLVSRLTCLSFASFQTAHVLLFIIHQQCCDRRFLAVKLNAPLFIIDTVCSIASIRVVNVSVPIEDNLLSSTIVVAFISGTC